MRGFSQNLAGNPARQVGHVFLPWPSQRLKQARQKLCWHGPCRSSTEPELSLSTAKAWWLLGAWAWAWACVVATSMACLPMIATCSLMLIITGTRAVIRDTCEHPHLCSLLSSSTDSAVQLMCAARTWLATPPTLTVTGRSQRLKQMTHLSVSSSRSGFLLASAAFLAACFLLPSAAAARKSSIPFSQINTALITQLRCP